MVASSHATAAVLFPGYASPHGPFWFAAHTAVIHYGYCWQFAIGSHTALHRHAGCYLRTTLVTQFGLPLVSYLPAFGRWFTAMRLTTTYAAAHRTHLCLPPDWLRFYAIVGFRTVHTRLYNRWLVTVLPGAIYI